MPNTLHYEIRVRGRLGPMMLQAFPTLTSHRHGDETLLNGPLADQAALYGVLHQLESLGLHLVAVRSIEGPADGAGE
jgi:hypothetical protein